MVIYWRDFVVYAQPVLNPIYTLCRPSRKYVPFPQTHLFGKPQ